MIDEHEPWLTLIGLRLVYERNVSRRSAVVQAAADRRGSRCRLGAWLAGAARARRTVRIARVCPISAYRRRMPTPYGSRGGMAFGAEELRVLRRALALALHPGPASAPPEDVQDCLRLAESVDEAVARGGQAARLPRWPTSPATAPPCPAPPPAISTLLEEALARRRTGRTPTTSPPCARCAATRPPPPSWTAAAALAEQRRTRPAGRPRDRPPPVTPTVPASRTRLLALPGGLAAEAARQASPARNPRRSSPGAARAGAPARRARSPTAPSPPRARSSPAASPPRPRIRRSSSPRADRRPRSPESRQARAPARAVRGPGYSGPHGLRLRARAPRSDGRVLHRRDRDDREEPGRCQQGQGGRGGRRRPRPRRGRSRPGAEADGGGPDRSRFVGVRLATSRTLAFCVHIHHFDHLPLLC